MTYGIISLIAFWIGWGFGYLGGLNSKRALESKQARARADKLREFAEKDGEPHFPPRDEWYQPKDLSVKQQEPNERTG